MRSYCLRGNSMGVMCTDSSHRSQPQNFFFNKTTNMNQQRDNLTKENIKITSFDRQHLKCSRNNLFRNTKVLVPCNFTEQRCIPLLWCACLHYLPLSRQKLRFHTCWCHRGLLQYQTRFWNHKLRNHFRCFQVYQFSLLWGCMRDYCSSIWCWIPPGYS